MRVKNSVPLMLCLFLLSAVACQRVAEPEAKQILAPQCGWQQSEGGFGLQIDGRVSAPLVFVLQTTEGDFDARLDDCVGQGCYYGSAVGILKVSKVERVRPVPEPLSVRSADGKIVEIVSREKIDTLEFLFQPSTAVTLIGWRTKTVVLPGVTVSGQSMFHQGFQAGTFAGWEKVPEIAWKPDEILWANDNEDKWSNARPGTSWWHTAVDLGDLTLVLGSAASLTRTTQTWLRSSGTAIEAALRTGIEGEQLYLLPGSNTTGEAWLAFCDAAAGQAMEHLGRIAAYITPRASWPYRQIGWSSWYYYYNDFRGEDLKATLANIGQLSERSMALSGQPPLIQVDDAWAAKWGDWRTSEAEGFGKDLTEMASWITAAGGRPGLWLAPLHADVDLPIVANHPDWWLRDRETGEYLRLQVPTLPDRYILDLSHPEAQKYLERLFRMLGEAGIGYLKIDFLHDALRPAKRFNESLTPVQWFKIFLTRIRIAATKGFGAPVFFVASLAPILPAAGLVNAMRVGPDIAYEIGRDPFWPWTLTEYRTVASRAWLHNLFAIDPDNLIVRGVTSAEEGMSFWGNVAAGGALLHGDALAQGQQPLGWSDELRARAISTVTGARILDVSEAALDTPIATPGTWLADSDVPACWELLGADLLVAFGWRLDMDTRCTLPGKVLRIVEGNGVVDGSTIRVEHGNYAVATLQ